MQISRFRGLLPRACRPEEEATANFLHVLYNFLQHSYKIVCQNETHSGKMGSAYSEGQGIIADDRWHIHPGLGNVMSLREISPIWGVETMRKILILVALSLFVFSWQAHAASKVDPKLYGAPEGQVCIKCHELKTPGLHKMWRQGKMGQAGVNCYDCHKAEKKTDEKKTDKVPAIPEATITGASGSRLLSAPRLFRCHKEQFDQQQVSHHAKAADILNSSDNYLGTVVGGGPQQ